ncbi:MAG: protein kinase [Anaerolineales bacterium]|nr:protein kinase [Anaerolineales bacterium]
MENIIGKQLGPYQVIEPIGEGGMAAIYKAYQPGVDRFVALKVLPQRLAEDPGFVGRFQQEARILAQLQHPHILPVFDYGESEGYTYIVMPYIKSGTLADLMHGSPFPLTQTITIISQLANALDYAHNKDLIHRDIKPSNILIDESGNCLLTDFGIAKLFTSTSRFTSTGGIIGTPDYMSPEQGQGYKLDKRSDVYSLGIILYEMVTGRVPFTAETPIATIFKHINDPLPAPHQFNSTVPESVELVVLRALAKKPADRFQTAGDLANALQTAVTNIEAGIPTQIEALSATVALGSAGRTKDAYVSRRLLPLTIILALLLIICGSGTFFIYTRVLNPQTQTTAVAPELTEQSPILIPNPSATTGSTKTASANAKMTKTATVQPTSTSTPIPTATLMPTDTPMPTNTPQIWPISPTGVEACHLTLGGQTAARENARLWSQPNVRTGNALFDVDPGAVVEIVEGPIWGPIRRDIDFPGWWWLVKTIGSSNTQEGWVWESRLEGCMPP